MAFTLVQQWAHLSTVAVDLRRSGQASSNQFDAGGSEAVLGRLAKVGRTKIQVAATWTDNRGNGSALDKLMTTRSPSTGYNGAGLLSETHCTGDGLMCTSPKYDAE